MLLKEKISEDLKNAMKEKREMEVSTLRLLSSAILNKEKGSPSTSSGNAKELSDEEAIEVVSSEVKKRKEAIDGFEKGGRNEMAQKEKAELDVLMKYLPEQLTDDKIQDLVKSAIEKVGAKELKDMGKVMAELAPQIKGKADGGVVSKIVKDLLIEN